VELRVTAGEDGRAFLAEIAFPATTPVAEAKEFLIRQLGEVLLRPCGERQWRHGPDHLTAHWPAAETGSAVCAWVELEIGVRENVVGVGPAAFTAAVVFDPAAGWDAERAEAWLAARHPSATPGRLAVLPRGARHPASTHRTPVVV
jgi:hypothetical protein